MTTEKLELERCLKRVEQQPDSAAAHFNLGLAYTQRSLVDRAEQSYRRALELAPDLVEAWVNLGGVLMLKWDFKGSLEANREALKRKEDSVLAHYNLGQACLYLGDAQGVVNANRRVIELDPQNAADGHFGQGREVLRINSRVLGGAHGHLGTSTDRQRNTGGDDDVLLHNDRTGPDRVRGQDDCPC